jgi:hypothetical protein
VGGGLSGALLAAAGAVGLLGAAGAGGEAVTARLLAVAAATFGAGGVAFAGADTVGAGPGTWNGDMHRRQRMVLPRIASPIS